MQEIIQSALLGVLEGLTEFLPISSTGHLIVAQELLGRTEQSDQLFTIVIQIGAIFAVLYHYRHKVYDTCKLFFTDIRNAKLAHLLVIAFIPAAVVGLLFHKTIKAHLFSTSTVAFALIVGGIAFLWIERHRKSKQILCDDIDDISYKQALIIGCCQVLALWPGVSRSGATIMGGLLLGFKRPLAAEFSFFLAIPTMFAAVIYDLYSNYHILDADLGVNLIIGLVAAFITALLSIRGLLAFLTSHTFAAFGYYRICAGLVMFGFIGLGWL